MVQKRLPLFFAGVVGLSGSILWFIPNAAIWFLNTFLPTNLPISGDGVPYPSTLLAIAVFWTPIAGLRSHQSAIGPLVTCVTSNSRRQDIRMLCGELAILHDLTSADHEKVKQSFMKIASDRSFLSRGHAFLVLGYNFKSDLEVQHFLTVALANEENESLRTLLVGTLSIMRAKEAVPVIYGLLQSKDKPFTRVRGVMALGSIGGSEGFSALTELLRTQNEVEETGWILTALGASKDPRAKEILFRYLNDRRDNLVWGALQGFDCMGDTSVISELEKMGTSNHRSLQFKLRNVIDSIRSGKPTPMMCD